MQHPTSLAFHALAAPALSDEQFFAATALLSTRFDARGAHGDIRSDPEAPAVLDCWFKHANARAPDLSIWQLTCQVHRFFESDRGRVLPLHWPWDAREHILSLNDHLRASTAWREVLVAAVARPESAFLDAIVCCAAVRVSKDPWRVCWEYLNEHIDDAAAWRVVAGVVDLRRLGGCLSLARRVLMLGVGSPGQRAVASIGVARFTGRPPPLCHVWREVLRLLERFPGHGVDLIERALVSPDTELRLQAAELLLVYWRGRPVPPDTITLLRECSLHEVDPSVREVMRMNLPRV